MQSWLSLEVLVLPEEKRLGFRIEINIGDLIQDDDRIYGNGVNIVARIER